MITVKHVHSSHDELVLEASQIYLSHGTQDQEGKHLLVTVPGEYNDRILTRGVVYVMNSAGKTVATYYLDE